MAYTNHCKNRMNQRGITKEMIDCVLMFGSINQDKYVLSSREAEALIAVIKKIKVANVQKKRKGQI